MDSAELHYVSLAMRFSKIGMQVALAYNNEQEKLDLAAVLSPKRLYAEQGTEQSLATLLQLRQLTQAHKQAYSKFMISATTELKGAINEMPAGLQEQRDQQLLSSIQRQLETQANFYANRERWINAAEEICNLVQSRRSNCTFTEAGIVFDADEDFANYQRLLAVIDETHQGEVEIFQERRRRLKATQEIFRAST